MKKSRDKPEEGERGDDEDEAPWPDVSCRTAKLIVCVFLLHQT